MEELYNLLKQVNYTKNSWNRKKIIGDIGKSCAFGYLQIPYVRVGYSNKTICQYDLYKKILNWGKKNLPKNFEFNCIYCNYNMKAKKHKDSLNVGDSYFCFIGDCSGGELKIYDKEDEDREIYRVKKNELYCFNGFEKYHETDDFEGERYSIIFYKNVYYEEQKIIDEYVVCIPSHNRANILNNKTLNMLKENNIDRRKIFIFVDKDEIKEYRKILDKKKYNRVLKGKKGLLNQRNYIKSIYPKGQRILFIDDDIESINYKNSSIFNNLNDLIINSFMECETKNISLWGLYPCNNDFFMKTKKEKSYNLKFIIGCFYGLINFDFECDITKKYNSNKEDMERSFICFEKDKKLLRYNKISFKTKYFNNVGGLGNFNERLEYNKLASLELEKKYNNMCKVYVRKNGMYELKFKKIK